MQGKGQSGNRFGTGQFPHGLADPAFDFAVTARLDQSSPQLDPSATEQLDPSPAVAAASCLGRTQIIGAETSVRRSGVQFLFSLAGQTFAKMAP
jgi:hypothetical protein